MIQSIINHIYRYPKSNLKTWKRFGGYLAYHRMIQNRKLMENKSLKLPPVRSYSDGLPLYFLTGSKYLYQTLFCIQSLVKVSKENFCFILVDDGSFDEKIIQRIIVQLPGAKIITQEMINKNLKEYLPKSLYPHLWNKRKIYPHIRKLTDIHTIPGNPWKLVLDSDMLFWNVPTEIVAWLKKPKNPLHMVDCEESYGYSRKLMGELCGAEIPSLLNVGVIGLRSEHINWQLLENWIKALEENEGTSYYLEQALTAMLVSGRTTEVLNKNEYIVKPTRLEIELREGILHHYVDLSKVGYFTKAWHNFI